MTNILQNQYKNMTKLLEKMLQNYDNWQNITKINIYSAVSVKNMSAKNIFCSFRDQNRKWSLITKMQDHLKPKPTCTWNRTVVLSFRAPARLRRTYEEGVQTENKFHSYTNERVLRKRAQARKFKTTVSEFQAHADGKLRHDTRSTRMFLHFV